MKRFRVFKWALMILFNRNLQQMCNTASLFPVEQPSQPDLFMCHLELVHADCPMTGAQTVCSPLPYPYHPLALLSLCTANSPCSLFPPTKNSNIFSFPFEFGKQIVPLPYTSRFLRSALECARERKKSFEFLNDFLPPCRKAA